MYDAILIPTDGSEQAMNAVEEGIRLASAVGATVHALYVVDGVGGRTVPMAIEQGESRADQREYGERVTGEVAEMADAAGVDCHTDVREGVAHSEIVDYVESEGVDAVVMGSRGHTTVTEALLGSTAEKVLRSVDVPVTLVHEKPGTREDWMVRAQGPVHG